MRKVIETKNAPSAIGNYSQAVIAGNTLYLAGQIPLDPATMELVVGDARVQITQIFKNMQAVLEAAGASFDNVVKFTVYLTDLALMPIINEVIAGFLKKPYPARTSIQVSALPNKTIAEVEAIAVLS